MVYAIWLAGLALLFVVLERLWPRRPTPLLRRGIFSDLAYIVLNSEYIAILIGVAAPTIINWLGLRRFELSLISTQSFWTQFVLLLLVMDFAKWCVHNLLHRVPWLWEFHKVHHSIVDLDWIGNWRFHWMETIVYRSLLYFPAALCGFRSEVFFWVGVLDTLVGHFAHANLKWRIGGLKYVVNSPEMHIWHHNHPDSGPVNRNFALTLSIWDWLFGTAHVPVRDPKRLGFTGIENYPAHLPGQWLAPFNALARGKVGEAGR